MSSKRPDAEQVIRDWLADSAPDRAPASLRDTLEDVTSRPPEHPGPWHNAMQRQFTLVARAAAAVVAMVLVATSAYLYANGRAAAPGPDHGTAPPSPSASMCPVAGGASAACVASTSPSLAISPSPTTGATPSPTIGATPSETVTQLPGSSWNLVSGALPPPTMAQFGYEQPLFVLPSGGFVALGTADSGGVPVFVSADGISWGRLAELPAGGATVNDITQSPAGAIVAVGTVQGESGGLDSAVAWTMSFGHSWQTTELSTADGSSADHVAVGPGGFLASGSGPTGGTAIWASADGTAWHAVAVSGISSDVNQPALSSNATGYVLAQSMPAQVWYSADGTRWTETYHAPALSGMSVYYMGPIVKAPDGSFRSFGGIYTGTGEGQPIAALEDTTIWTSTDMTRWTMTGSVKTPGWGGDPVPIAGGFAMAGTETQPAYTPVNGPLGVWTSANGRIWKPLPGLSSLPESQVLAVVGDGKHVVVAFVDPTGNLELLVGQGLE